MTLGSFLRDRASPAPFAAVLLLSLTAACSGGGQGGATSRDASSAANSYPSTDYYETAAGAPGGVLRISASADTGTLDLHAISHTNAQWLGRLIYDNLVYLDDKGQPTPWLAKSWEISPDGKTYTFHLRDDVTFSDGSKFDAEAVRINLEHMRDPATKSPLAAAYIAPYVDGKAVDPYTFKAHLREPYAPFLNVLAQSWLAMESPKAITERPKEIGQKPVGSGPFVVQSYTRQQGVVLTRRPDYHWAPGFIRHEGPALLDRVEIAFVPEAMTRFGALAAGQQDLTIDAPWQNAAAIRSDPRLVLDKRVRTGIPMTALTFNTEKAPFDDVRVRRALAHAVDREGVLRAVRFGEIAPKADFLAANTRYYDPAYAKVLGYDPALAGKLLDEAGWSARDAEGYRVKDGKRLSGEVLTADGANQGPMIVAVQSDLKKVGAELKITVAPQTVLQQRRLAADYVLLAGGVWHTNTPDALYILYQSGEISSDRRIGQNVSRLKDVALDDLLAKARRSSDPAEAQALYSQAQKRLTELVPAIPLTDNVSIVGYNRRLKGLFFDTSHNTPVFIGASLQEERP